MRVKHASAETSYLDAVPQSFTEAGSSTKSAGNGGWGAASDQLTLQGHTNLM